MALNLRATYKQQVRGFALAVALVHLLTVLAVWRAEAAGLTIAKGVVVEGGVAGQLVVRDPLVVDEAHLTSDKAHPNPGDWLGVLLFGSATGSRFTGTTLDSAGGSGAALDLLGASPSLNGMTVRNSSGIGIRLSEGASPTISDSLITGNNVGIEAGTNANPVLQNSSLAGNSFGFRNLEPTRLITAINNWWGDPSGPTCASNPGGLGVPVSNGVSYTPWSSVIPILGASFTIAQGTVTESADITLNLTCQTCSEIRASEDPSFSGSSFIPLAQTSPFTLSSVDDLKTVYVQFRTDTRNTRTLSTQVRLDTAGPTLTVRNPVAGSLVGRPVTITAEAVDPAGVARVEFYVDGTLAATNTAPGYTYYWDVLTVADGGHELKVIASDTVGHFTTDVRMITVSKVPPPSPVITSPSAGLINTRTVNVSGTAEPKITVTLYLNNYYAVRTTATAAGTFQFSGIPLSEGPAKLTATASDPIGMSRHSDPVQLTVDTGPPAAPRFYQAVAATGGGIKLEWTPEVGDVPARYRLFRATAPFAATAEATLVSSTLTATSYVDIPPADGVYYFGLTALDAADNESPLSTIISATSDRTPPSAGVVFSPASPVGPGVVAVTITVSEPLPAPPYLGIAPAGDIPLGVDLIKVTDTLWTGVYTVNGLTHHGGATVSFAARDIVGNRGTVLTSGDTLNIDTRGPVGTLALNPAPALIKPGTVVVTLTFDEPVVGKPALSCKPPSGVITPIPLTGSGTTWAGSLVITPAMGDGPVSFSFTAQDRFGNNGSTLTSDTAITLDVTPPVAPANLVARSLPSGTVKLIWNAVVDAATYRVYRGPSSAPLSLPATPVAENLAAATYYDLPPSDSEYRYGVTAVDRAGNESILSTMVTVVPDRMAPGAPSGLTRSLTGATVQLSWAVPPGEPATGYNLYRSLTAITGTAGLTPLKPVPAATTTTDVPPEDGRYYYAVTALDAAGNEGTLSNVVSLLYSLSPPLITVTGVSIGQFSAASLTPVITVKSASPGSQSILLDGVPFMSGTPFALEGKHLLHVEATDTQSRTSIKDVAFTIDLTDPVVSVTGVTDGGFYETVVTPGITANDINLNTTVITLNGAPYVSGTPITTDGAWTLRVEARDLADRTTVATVKFALDVAPPLPATLTVTSTQGGSAELSWAASTAADVVGYHIYKNGVKLTSGPLNALSYTDALFSGDATQFYELSVVDKSGHESIRMSAAVLPVQIVMKGYGRTLSSGPLLSKQYIESFKTEILNNHTESVVIGSIVHELRDNLSTVAGLTQNGPITVTAGAALTSDKTMPVGAGIVDYRTYRVTLTLPATPGVTVKKVASFALNAFDPGRKIEVFNEPLVKGELARIRLKIANHGSVPIEVLTAAAGQSSTDVYVLLKDQNGNVIAKGNLNQKGVGVINYSSYSLAEIPPTATFLSNPVEFVVPLTAPDKVYIEAYVTSIYFHYLQADQITAGPLSGYTSVMVSQAAYSAIVTSDRLLYDQNTPVILSGSALDITTGLPVPNTPVKIGIGVKGFDRYLVATTDATGHFSTAFTPLNGEAGNYTIWATHPAVFDKPVQAGFTIYGMTFEPQAVNLRMSKNAGFTMPITIRNQGEADLTGIRFSVNSGAGIAGTLDTAGSDTTLAGGKSTSVNLTLAAAMDAPDAGSASVTVATSEGISRVLDISIALLPALPTVTTDPNYIEVGVSRNSSRVVTFKLKNTGYAPLEGIRIEPPTTTWMGLASDTNLPPLAPGKSVDIGIIFRPTVTVEQGIHADKLVIASGNHVPYTLNLFATVTSTRTGGVHFQAVDSLNKKVADASVIISHQQLGSVILSGMTDTQGEISFVDITEGIYNYKVQAPGHEIVIGTFEIKPEVVTPLEVFMNNVFVTYEWSVTPVTFSDKYDIKLNATFETQVPAPVITIDPAYQRLELEIGSTYAGEYRVTNHGLVALDNVKIAPAYGPGLRVETLITELPRIGPQETIIIPYRITVNPFKSPSPVDPCSEIPMNIAVGGDSICIFGTKVFTSAITNTTIIPKEQFDLLGLCDAKCDWCDCLPGAAGSLCKCVKNRDLCECAGYVYGGDTASGLCKCAKKGKDPSDVIDCLNATGLGGAVVSVIKQLMDAGQMIKSGVNCALCIADILPPLVPPTYVSGPSGGGGFGGALNIGGGGIDFGPGCKP